MKTKSSEVLFTAVGDISFCGEIEKDMAVHGYSWPFAKMFRYLQASDLLFGNMESVSIPENYPKKSIDKRGLVSKLPGKKVAALLKQTGFSFLNMAANHVLDAGVVGMDYTKKCLEEAGIVVGGIGHSQKDARKLKIMDKNGIRFGFLCYCEDNSYTLGHTDAAPAYYKVETVVEDVKKAKEKVDILVVSIHADIEFMPTPSVPRLNNSRRIAKAGADIILEHHPHVPQGVEMVNGCLIAYSLGNFLFDSHTFSYMKDNGPYTAYSFLLNIRVDKKGVKSFERIPFNIQEPPEQRPAPLTGSKEKKMTKYLLNLDELLKNEKFVKDTWREVAKRHLQIYIRRAAEQDIDRVMSEMVGRLCLVAESRSWMDEILKMGAENWEAQKLLRDPLHKPHYYFQEMKPKKVKK